MPGGEGRDRRRSPQVGRRYQMVKRRRDVCIERGRQAPILCRCICMSARRCPLSEQRWSHQLQGGLTRWSCVSVRAIVGQHLLQVSVICPNHVDNLAINADDSPHPGLLLMESLAVLIVNLQALVVLPNSGLLWVYRRHKSTCICMFSNLIIRDLYYNGKIDVYVSNVLFIRNDKSI